MIRSTHDQVNFTIPEELEPLLKEIATAKCYKSTPPDAGHKKINCITSPQRSSGVEWFNVPRMRKILNALISKSELPPIELDHIVATNKFYVHNGFHRYYASIAADFVEIPFTIYESC